MKHAQTKYLFMMGNSAVYGTLVCQPDNLSEVQENVFYKQLKESLEKINANQKEVETALLQNSLIQGVTIGSEYYQIRKFK